MEHRIQERILYISLSEQNGTQDIGEDISLSEQNGTQEIGEDISLSEQNGTQERILYSNLSELKVYIGIRKLMRTQDSGYEHKLIEIKEGEYVQKSEKGSCS